ncbi:MAG: TfuA-related McrA-glycine thioamidation protein [Euryarchaeota archaeon]|nr:TfuA-related McrA-glycine thioamidation protein [Euryarchaeota archaeon]
MRSVVFVGMSIGHEEAGSIFRSTYLPPIRRGDIPKLDEDVKLVGIIDGVFSSESSVGHREIISLLKRGVTVVGGGSMGALRAAELQDMGMIGVGRIFELFRDGTLEGDDEVALVFDPETFQPLSEPLVNIRYLLSSAVKSGVIEVEEKEALIKEMKALYYPRRSFFSLLASARDNLGEERAALIKKMIDSDSFDLKRSDSLKVLYTMKELQIAHKNRQ